MTDMRIKQKKIRILAGILLTYMLLTGMTVMPGRAAEAASEDVIIITPDEEAEQETGTGEDGGQAEEDAEDVPEDEPQESEEEPEEPEQPVIKPIKLKQPGSFQTEAVKDGIKLSWKKVAKAQKYEIYRKKSGGDGDYKLVKTTKKCTYTDKTAKYGVTYLYKVRARAVSNGKTYRSAYSAKKSCCTYHIDPSKPMVALTFDDGPSQYTPGILDALEKYESRATFFEVGNRVNWYPDTVLRISKLGCEIGNHSYDHALLGNASAAKIRSEISTTDAKIKAITGKKPTLLRPPYGSIGSSLRQNAGKPMILWSIDTLDWKSRNADAVYRNVINQVKDGDIILMHDIYSSTRTAVTRIVPELRKRGYQLVTVSELAQYRNVKLTAGGRYSQMRP